MYFLTSISILTGSLFTQGVDPGTINLTPARTFNNMTANDYVSGQSPSFHSYINPVIPGDHPDPTLTKIDNYFYTSGSSFNPTPKIYRSTDLVHWEVIAQPVSASWSGYGDDPGDGIWGGHMVLYNDIYWHFFGRGGGSMYFVTANQPEGPWSNPTRMEVPSGMSGLGVDNSIFIDDETGKWYLLTKAGPENNHIVELGEDGQPAGVVLDLTWLNPDSEGNPYGWAEGPVMWKCNGYYYYSFAQHLVGEQYVMRSDTLTDEEPAWTIIGDNIFTGSRGTFNTPNHISPVVLLNDSTSWTIVHSYHSSSSWYAQGRQGLLCQVMYNDQGFPVIQFPPNTAVQAPALPGSGIPWMVPKSDMFNSSKLKPDWSFLGYTPDNTYSLTERDGWLYLKPYQGSNTVIQNDGEHSYSLITRVDFQPESTSDEAGLWIINGPETHYVKVFTTANSDGESMLAFRFEDTSYAVENTIGSTVWFKLLRNEHMISGFYSSDGFTWIRIGEPINAAALDMQQTQYNNFTGSQQGLYVEGKSAFFDLYIYRDAYTKIAANNPANGFGTSPSSSYLRSINNDDWAMYAGVFFGGSDYQKYPSSMEIEAASATSGGVVEVWLDSIDTGKKIGECKIENTVSLLTYKLFTAEVDTVSGMHDVYLRFLGTGTEELFRLKWFRFLSPYDSPTKVENIQGAAVIRSFSLNRNYPNPFNPVTTIIYDIPISAYVQINIYDVLGRHVAALVDEIQAANRYSVRWNASNFGAGVYFCKMVARNKGRSAAFTSVRKLLLLK
jgi:xylan 1,4-beta-xylosidase